MSDYTINVQPLSLRGTLSSGTCLLDAITEMGVRITGLCGGNGVCGRCRIQIISGKVSEPSHAEQHLFSKNEIAAGYRLACHTYPRSDLTVHIPSESLSAPQRLQVEGEGALFTPDPIVRKYSITLPRPSVKNTRGDDRRLIDSLKREHGIVCHSIDLETLRILPKQLRSCNWSVDVYVRGDEIIAIRPQNRRLLGIAIDLGTTKIAGYLVDLETGGVCASKGIMNPQIAHGEDVITRIVKAVRSTADKEMLQEILISALNKLNRELCQDIQATIEEIMEIVIVGNTAIHHLLLRVPADTLARAPHVAGVCRSMDIKARYLGLDAAKGAYVHLPANIAGFVGGDHVAMLLASDVNKSAGPLLAVDIGTNTEISLAFDGRITSVSCASGPAFEGYHISCGMRAAEGAIEHVRIDNDIIQYQTIFDSAPIGICGSGIFDVLAQFYINGIIDRRGRMNHAHPRIRKTGQMYEFVLIEADEKKTSKSITVTQKDIRELQLAKAAIRTGINALLMHNDVTAQDIGNIVVAGAFGSFIDISSAITIGMFPDLPSRHFSQVGNAAGTGAKIILTSGLKRAEAVQMADRIQYVELGGNDAFNDMFVTALDLGKGR